ncbi:MAG TPA: glutamate--tRNA ligase [Candidatus Thermoplasmatota archaeon]|nr:glutamate--tRNA ligase [Candidatus Thermoplasmatota archaeon]
MSDIEATVKALARKYALENAVKHGGKANPGAVVGKIMGENPDLRAHAKTIPQWSAATVAEVNTLTAEQQRAEFEAYQAEFEAKAKAKADAKSAFPLKPLPNAEKGKVVMRLAPNPSGPPHMGHARGFVINWLYKQHYDGKFILRYDDTDTTVKPPMPEAYGWILDGMRWLCGEPDMVFAASDHMEHYYHWAEETFKVNGAYVCECPAETFRALKEQGEPCPHRGQSVEVNLQKWRDMLAGKYKRGEVTVRIKTDIQHKDPALRDWVAFRIAEDPHPKVGTKYRVWPLLDFQSAIDDRISGVTHIIRGKDLRDSTAKQFFLYEHLGWKYPETLYWGRVSIHEFGKFSKSILSEAIKKGEYEGWDDPRLPTLTALRRRGFTAEGIRNFWVSLGLSEKDIAASLATVEAENKKVVEPIANRYFWVADPVKIRLTGAAHLDASAPLHGDDPARGSRLHHLEAANGAIEVYVPREDLQGVAAGSKLRLKDLANLEFTSDTEARYLGNELEFLKQPGVRIIHWAPVHGVRCRVKMPDATVVEGIAEEHVAREKVDALLQFERVGFVRVDAIGKDGILCYFTHK